MQKSPTPPRKSPAGRKKSPVIMVKKSISLSPSTYEYLTTLGEGKLSRGVQLAAQAHKENSQDKQS